MMERAAMHRLPASSRSPARHLLVMVAAGLLAVGACGDTPETQEEPPRPVKIVTIGDSAGGGPLEYPGEVSAAQEADLAFQVGGKIQEFPVNEGQTVRTGEVLAVLDPRDYEARRDAARAQANEARAEHERYRGLYEENAVSLQQLEIAQRAYEVADANLRTAEKAVQDTRLTAPFAGVVATKLVENFQTIQPQQPILKLQDTSGLEIVVDFPESDWDGARSGLTGSDVAARVVVSAFPGRSFPARVKEIATAADPVTRTFAATFSFPAPDDVSVLPGMTAKLVLPAGEGEGGARDVEIPARAVAADAEGNACVWRLDPATMTVHRVYVQVGAMEGEVITILGGLVSGDQVVVSGLLNLREGLKVSRLGE